MPYCDGEEELQLPHDSAAAAAFLDGLDPVDEADLGTAGDNRVGCFPVPVLLLVATDSGQREFAVTLQVY